MKKNVGFFFFALCISRFAFPQQYGWEDISKNLPDYPYDTIIGVADTGIAILSDLCFISADEGWVTTWHPYSQENAAILHTTDGGDTWEVQTVMRPCAVIHMLDQNTGYAGSDGGLIFKTADGGGTWTYYGITGAPLRGMSFVPGSDTGYVCSDMSANLQQITPQGVNPVSLGNTGWWKTISTPSNDLIWIGDGTSVWTFDKEGLTDQPITSAHYNSIFFTRNDLGWGAGYEGVKSRNQGVIAGCKGKNIDWVHLKYTERPLSNIFALDDNHVWAAGFDGYIYYSENASQFGRDTSNGSWWSNVTFVSQPNPRPDADFRAVFFTSPQNGFATAQNNILLKYTQVNAVSENAVPDVRVFPNPTSGKSAVRSRQSAAGSQQSAVRSIEIMDLFGKIVFTREVKTGSENAEFDISHLPAGVYFCRVTLSNSITVKKIVKL